MTKRSLIVTTVYQPAPALTAAAKDWAKRLDTVFVPRERHSLPSLKQLFQVENLLISTRKGPVADTPGGLYFFHLSMAELRIKNLTAGNHDHMVAAMDLTAGKTVLDCTLGLATDAIVASFITGPQGSVTGLEVSPVLALIASAGLGSLDTGEAAVTGALRRIRVVQADYRAFLAAQPDKSVDIVYFDPMFRIPVAASSNLKPLRYLADPRPLDEQALQQAGRVAQKRIVIKETRGSRVFRDLNITEFAGGRYSQIQYGIIRMEG